MSTYTATSKHTFLPNLLILSGLDPSGGAGFIADLTVAHAHQIRPVGTLTATTVQTTQGVKTITPSNPEHLVQQVTALCDDLTIAAVKIGMIPNDTILEAIVQSLQKLPSTVPIVWDPVLAPTLGDTVFYIDDPTQMIATLTKSLPNHQIILTPNSHEAHRLCAVPPSSHADITDDMIKSMGETLLSQGLHAVLIKGGNDSSHLTTQATDFLITKTATTPLSLPHIAVTHDIHGTGCALSTALGCYLINNIPLIDAALAAKQFVHQQLSSPVFLNNHGRPSIV